MQLFATYSLLRVSQLSRPFWHNCYVFSRPFQPHPIFPPFSPAPGFSTLATNFFLFPLFHPFNVSEHFLPSLNTHCNFPRFTIPFSSFPLFSSTCYFCVFCLLYSFNFWSQMLSRVFATRFLIFPHFLPPYSFPRFPWTTLRNISSNQLSPRYPSG